MTIHHIPAAERRDAPAPAGSRAGRSGSFVDNMSLPFHRWFRYSAGFSAQWAEQVIRDRLGGRPDALVLDPFAGSGTTLLAARAAGLRSIGIEAHDVVARIARAKLTDTIAAETVEAAGQALLDRAQRLRPRVPADIPPLLARCYTPQALARLLALRAAWRETQGDLPVALADLLWLAITAILRETSGVGTAQWQYILPNKTKAQTADPFAAFAARIALFCRDLRGLAAGWGATAEIVTGDARSADLPERADLVLTSPPYPNNYDYADATRLEMTFWGEVSTWSDLHARVRTNLVCACSQHSAAAKISLDEVLASELLAPIGPAIATVTRELEALRTTRAGRKTYHTMVAAYFLDLALVWRNLQRLMKPGAAAVFMIGDSAPYGVHVPCEAWLGELALAAGFRSFHFEPVRDRNTKWKNRKHSVPLKEGILTVLN